MHSSLFLVFSFFPDPIFVGSSYIEESQPVGNPVSDDDKIYFFFSEAGKEFDFFDNTIVSRIARVCKVRHVKLKVGCLLQAAAIELPFPNPCMTASEQGRTHPRQSAFDNEPS